jgi:hypothetical protein
MKSKSLFVKCRPNGELSGGRKALSLAVWALHPASYSKKYIGFAILALRLLFLLYDLQERKVCFL